MKKHNALLNYANQTVNTGKTLRNNVVFLVLSCPVIAGFVYWGLDIATR